MSDGVAQLGDEDGAEEADTDGDDDVGRALQPPNIIHVGHVDNSDAILHHPAHAEPNRHNGHEDGQTEQRTAVPATQRCADHMDLNDQRGHDADDQQGLKDDRDNGDAVCTARDGAIVAAEEGVDLLESGGEMNDLEEQAQDVEHQGHAIQNEDGRATLVAVRQKKQEHEEHERGSELGAIVDAETDVVLAEQVQIVHGRVDCPAIWSVEGDVLQVRVKVGRHGRGHLGGWNRIGEDEADG